MSAAPAVRWVPPASPRQIPTGYTLLLYHIGQATSVSLYRKLPYEPAEDFTPVGRVTDVPMTIVARPTISKPPTPPTCSSYITKNKEEVTLVNAGIGSASHLCGMLLMEALGHADDDHPLQGHRPRR